jgi:hypothetical protein
VSLPIPKPARALLRGTLSPGIVFGFVTIALGVACMVVALALQHGASVVSRSPINGLGPDVVTVVGVPPAAEAGVEAGVASSSLTAGDLAALGNRGYVPDASVVTPATGTYITVSTASTSAATNVVGTTDTYAATLGYSVAAGRLLSSSDVAEASPVAVLGATVARALFVASNPVGQTIVADGQSLQVVGTLRARGFSGSYDQDNLVLVPITTLWKAVTPLRNMQIGQILLRAPTPPAAERAAREATATLLSRHGIVDPDLADFTVIDHSRGLGPQVQTARAIRVVLELAAGAFLLLGLLQLLRPLWSSASGAEGLLGGLLGALAGVAVGVVAGALLAPGLHRLASSVVPTKLTAYAALAGAIPGLIAAGAPLVLLVLVGRLGSHRSEQR